ncbi:MAG: hypothetical protein H7039_00385 [Bryobacteraceae bacterium]|nr:hypothetical protein [Bryobacteraceae bacterium]
MLFDSAAVNFSGPVNIQSRARGAFKLLKSLVSAPVCTVDLRGAGSEILFAESTLRATAGPLAVALGDEAKFEIGKVFSGQTDALSATDKLTVAAGRKFVAGLLGVNVRGNAGIHFNLTGDEVSLKSLDGNTFSAAQGSIQINGSGSKSLLEIADTQLLFGQSFGITLSGNENTIKLNKSTIGPSSGTASAGITISAGTIDDNGKVEASEVTLRRARFATIGASRSHGSGLLKWEKGTASIAGNLSFEGSGFTEVKDSSITSPGTIRIANTTGGSCSGASNSLSAPVLQICPPF